MGFTTPAPVPLLCSFSEVVAGRALRRSFQCTLFECKPPSENPPLHSTEALGNAVILGEVVSRLTLATMTLYVM